MPLMYIVANFQSCRRGWHASICKAFVLRVD